MTNAPRRGGAGGAIGGGPDEPFDDDDTEDVPALPTNLRAQFFTAALSDIGLRRSENQDRALALRHAVVVADGVGGSHGGAFAAQAAVDELRSRLAAPLDEVGTNAAIRAAAEAADGAIRRHAAEEGWPSCATTVVGAVRVADGPEQPSRVVIGNVGDSPAMLWRDGALHRLTEDHTVQVTAGDSTSRSVLTRCLGGGVNDVRPDLVTIRTHPGDVFVLCSDGLTKELDDLQIAMVLADGRSPADTCRSLVDVALAKGARDNVSVAILAEGRRSWRGGGPA